MRPSIEAIRSCAEALRLLKAHRRELDALAEALLERETLDERQILEVTGLKQDAVKVKADTPGDGQRPRE